MTAKALVLLALLTTQNGWAIKPAADVAKDVITAEIATARAVGARAQWERERAETERRNRDNESPAPPRRERGEPKPPPSDPCTYYGGIRMCPQ